MDFDSLVVSLVWYATHYKRLCHPEGARFSRPQGLWHNLAEMLRGNKTPLSMTLRNKKQSLQKWQGLFCNSENQLRLKGQRNDLTVLQENGTERIACAVAGSRFELSHAAAK